MATPMEVNARHGDESQAAHRRNHNIWLWAALAVVVLLAVIYLLSRAGTGPAANTGRVSADTADVQAGVAPGVAATYAGQPGGRADGTPTPNANPAAGPANGATTSP